MPDTFHDSGLSASLMGGGSTPHALPPLHRQEPATVTPAFDPPGLPESPGPLAGPIASRGLPTTFLSPGYSPSPFIAELVPTPEYPK